MSSRSFDSTELDAWLRELLASPGFLRLSLSQPVPDAPAQKIQGRPLLIQDQPVIQLARRVGKQEHHQNLDLPDATRELIQLLSTSFRQLNLLTRDADYTLKRNPDGQVLCKATKPSARDLVPQVTHNRNKQYLIPEGTPVPFLMEMGVMNADGKVLAPKTHKFRQINRFLEMVDDVLPRLPQDRPLRIVDFGAGKSYLTFAVHHLLTTLRGLEVHTTAVDRNADVINHCRATAQRIGCRGLEFHAGDIGDFLPPQGIDLVISLHACDTATDDVLAQAVRGNVPVILSAPCCQHELAPQLANPALEALLRHGILRERFGAMLTDALLEVCGYQTQLLEFIDLEHTPKNLLIRAIRRDNPDQGKATHLTHYQSLKHLSGLTHFHLEKLLTDHLLP